MSARVAQVDDRWAVLYDGWRTEFVTEDAARSTAADFDAGVSTPDEWISVRDDSLPVGEVPPCMDEHDALSAAVEKVGLDIWRDRDAVVQAAKDLRRIEHAGVEVDSDVWVDAMQRLRDATDRLPVVFDIPGGAS